MRKQEKECDEQTINMLKSDTPCLTETQLLSSNIQPEAPFFGLISQV